METINIDGTNFSTEYLKSHSMDLDVYRLLDNARTINGHSVSPAEFTSSTLDCKSWQSVSRLKGMIARNNRRKIQKKRVIEGLPTFRYRSCDPIAYVLEVGTPEFRAAQRLCKLVPGINLYKEGTYLGMQPSEPTEKYWLTGF